MFVAITLSVSIIFWRVFGYSHRKGLSRIMQGMSHNIGHESVQLSSGNDEKEATLSWVSFYLATDQPWSGQEVVDALLEQGLTLGEDGLFVYEQDGCPLFRVAQATHPVSFDMDLLNETVLSGLAFFMDAAEVPMPKKAFNQMVSTMKAIAHLLNGLLVDQSQLPLTPEDLVRIEQQLPHDESILIV